MRTTLILFLLVLTIVPVTYSAEADKNGIITQETKSKLLVIHGDLRVEFGLAGRRAAQITSIEYCGKDYLIKNSGAYIRSFGVPMENGAPTISAKEAKATRHKWKQKTIVEDGYTEIRFSETATKRWPMATDIGWVFRRDEPGLYYYLS